jgi:hypothetical protein
MCNCITTICTCDSGRSSLFDKVSNYWMPPSFDIPGVGQEFIHNSKGIKHDQEKPDPSLISAQALMEVAKVMSYGAKKYGANNWRKGIVMSRIIGACLRHLYAYMAGEDKDPESGLPHLSHFAASALFLLHFHVTDAKLDDRYTNKGE